MVISTKEDPVVAEVTVTLREWHQIWTSLYLDNQSELFERIGSIILNLIEARNELLKLLRPVGTFQDSLNREQQINELKTDIVNKLDLGNHLLGLDLVLRDSHFRPIDPIGSSPIKLYQLYSEASRAQLSAVGSSELAKYGSAGGYQRYGGSLASNHSSLYTLSQTGSIDSSTFASTQSQQNTSTYHLQLALKKYHLVSLPADELIEIYMSVVELSGNSNPQFVPLTDKFLIKIKSDQLACATPNTVFANLGSLANRDIGILIQVYRVGRMILADGYKTSFGKQQSSSNMAQSINLEGYNGSNNNNNNTLTATMGKQNPNSLTRSRHSTIGGYFHVQPTYRRPFGVTFIPLKDYYQKSSNILKEFDINARVSTVTNESEFSQLSELYLKKTQIKSNQNVPNIQMELSIKCLSCAQESITRLSTLNSYCLTSKRGYPDIVMPGDFKNELYLTLEGAEFEKGGKSISKNIEASISLIDKSGLVIGDCISIASNCDKVSNYNSCVYYHSNSPRWNECIKINVPLAEFDGAHIRIEFKHCSTKERDKKFLGFCFLPLSDEDGTVIGDKTHEMYLYKCDSQMWEGEPLNLCKYTSLHYGPSSKAQSKQASQQLHHQQQQQQPNQQHNFTHSSREIVTVSTFLLSTKLTQNSNLLNLLKWRELIKQNHKEFGEVLKNVLTLKGEEIVKFLQDILDTLFDTFTMYTLYPNSDLEYDYSALIFKVLVHIFLLLDEPKYQHFKPVIDTYASAHFSATLVYKGLLACLKECLEHSTFVERHGKIQSCLKSIKYIFLFIVQSKLLYSKATGEQNDKLFIKDLKHLFRLFETILANENPKLIPIQETLLQSFPSTFEQLTKVLSPQELVDVVISLAGSVGWQLPPPLARAKLIFMRETVNSSLIKNQDARLRIAENFCVHLECYLRNFDELDICHDVLESLIVKIHDYHWPSIHRMYQLILEQQPRTTTSGGGATTAGATTGSDDCVTPAALTASLMPLVGPMITVGEIDTFAQLGQIKTTHLDLALINVTNELEPIVRLLESLIQLLDMLVQDFNSDAPLIQKYSTCLLTILKLMSRESFKQFMRLKLDYFKLCQLFKSLRGVYDPDWSIMQLTSHAILEHPIDEISKKLLKSSAPPSASNRSDNNSISSNHHYHHHHQQSNSSTRQYGSYINLIVDFITHPTLQLESFSERKKNYIVHVFGDLRLKFTNQLVIFWQDLTRANICDLIPISIQAFLDVALLPNNELQKQLIPFFWDIIDAEETFKMNLRQIERCLMDNLDIFMNLDRGDLKFIENFESILKRLIRERSPTWEHKGLKLIESFTKLMQLLINYRQSLECYDQRSKQMNCLVDLLSFYKDQERMDIYLKYLFKLCDMHLESGNHTEAAFTLKLYADEIRWCNRNLGALDEFKGLKFPEEQEWCRKEKLYLKMINYFDLGKCWEESISLCKELASFYENFLVDYEKVSSILKKLAQFLDNILTEHRPEREYFRVEFLGSDLPEFVSGKELIYRGGEYERLATFIQRITFEFPDAKVLSSKSRQSMSADCKGQYLVISNVRPVPFLQDHFKSGQRAINDKIIQYYLNNRLDTFSHDLPIVKSTTNTTTSGGDNQQQQQQATSTMMTTSTSNEMGVRNLWVERYMLKIRKQLPDILPWSEVISHETIEISPINNAIETISSMNLELSKLILSFTKEPNRPISPLTMRLQGIIEAAVNGGPAVIVNAFFKQQSTNSDATTKQNASDLQSLIKLRDLFKQQYAILETGLALHSKLAPPEVMPLHERLVERLPKIREILLEDTNQIENTYEVLDVQQQTAATGTGTATTVDSGAVLAVTDSSNNNNCKQTLASAQSDLGGCNAAKAALDEVDGLKQPNSLNGNLFNRTAPTKGTNNNSSSNCGNSMEFTLATQQSSSFKEDQIYSQPASEQQLAFSGGLSDTRLPTTSINGGTRSELSSPSSSSSARLHSHSQHQHHPHNPLPPQQHRHHHHHFTSTSQSSSLSTLAVLGNLPVNRSRISITPSKEVVAAYKDSMRVLNDLSSMGDSCARASRRLTYDQSPANNNNNNNRISIDLSKAHHQLQKLQLDVVDSGSLELNSKLSSSLTSTLGSTSSSSTSQEIAPPLPPKLFLSKDKKQQQQHHHHQASRTTLMNRSSLIATNNSSRNATSSSLSATATTSTSQQQQFNLHTNKSNIK